MFLPSVLNDCTIQRLGLYQTSHKLEGLCPKPIELNGRRQLAEGSTLPRSEMQAENGCIEV